MGCIGIAYDDFCKLTVDEFNATCAAYNEREEQHYKSEWERMRLLASITIQPHLKKKITPQSLLPFPWESKREERGEVEKSSKERFEEISRRFSSL